MRQIALRRVQRWRGREVQVLLWNYHDDNVAAAATQYAEMVKAGGLADLNVTAAQVAAGVATVSFSLERQGVTFVRLSW